MKRNIVSLLVLLLLLLAIPCWKIFGPSLHQPEGKFFYIHTGATYAQVKDSLVKEKIISNSFWFDKVAKQLKYPSLVKPGKYQVQEHMSVMALVRMLRNGRQTPVNMVISRKLRFREDLAKLAGQYFEFDSAAMYTYLSKQENLQSFGVDSATFITAVLPDTYTFFWNTTPQKVYTRLYEESQKFWTPERKEKARSLGLSPQQVYTLASIVEEETRYGPDKPKIASVYLNRLNKNMPLEADPTAKFALKDFGLTRIYYSHLKVESPYNTYKNKGLPPGPICMVQKSTIDSVLNAPKTDYIFFVADSDFSGRSVFTTNYKDHQAYAKAFSKAQDSVAKLRQQRMENTDK